MIDRPTARFSERASAYAANRPGYPPAALDALLEGLGPPERLTIADIGAGTGIAARLLAERGATVFAVEPNHSMTEQAEPDPRIEWIDGTGEDTHVPSKSVDLAGASRPPRTQLPGCPAPKRRPRPRNDLGVRGVAPSAHAVFG